MIRGEVPTDVPDGVVTAEDIADAARIAQQDAPTIQKAFAATLLPPDQQANAPIPDEP